MFPAPTGKFLEIAIAVSVAKLNTLNGCNVFAFTLLSAVMLKPPPAPRNTYLGVENVKMINVESNDTEYPIELRGHYVGIYRVSHQNKTYPYICTEIAVNCEGAGNIPKPIVFARSSYSAQTPSQPVWSDWIRVDNFGCSTPADLASLLGAEKGSFTGSKTFPESSCGILMLVEAGGGRSVGCYLFDAFTVSTIKDGTSFIESVNVSNYRLTVTGKRPAGVYNYTWIRTYQT